MEKQILIETLLEKRFGEKNPEKINNLIEINTFSSNNEENSIGIGVQIIFEDGEEGKKQEEYQVSAEGIIYSWGNSPVLDERSLENKLIN